MELWQEILLRALKKEAKLNSLTEEVYLEKLLNSSCYLALKKIKEILENDDIDDPECFMRIEEIVCVLEEFGTNGGGRHDFG